MKFLRIFIAILLMLSFTACVSQSKPDVYEFAGELGAYFGDEINIDDFTVRKDKQIVYEYLLNPHTLLCLYTDNSGIISQCTLTNDEENVNFYVFCEKIADIFCEADKSDVEKIKNGGKIQIEDYLMVMNVYDVGRTFIINFADNEINTNTFPTLKGYIDEKEISRPTAIDSP